MQYIYKSNVKNFEFELTNCDGTPVDLSEATIKFIVKKHKEDDDSTAVLSSEIVNSETNNIMFQFDAVETANIEEGQYVCALKIFKENNVNMEIWNDNIKVERLVFND